MQTYTMAVKVEGKRPEYTRHLTEDQLPQARENARKQPRGSVFTIKVTADR